MKAGTGGPLYASALLFRSLSLSRDFSFSLPRDLDRFLLLDFLRELRDRLLRSRLRLLFRRLSRSLQRSRDLDLVLLLLRGFSRLLLLLLELLLRLLGLLLRDLVLVFLTRSTGLGGSLFNDKLDLCGRGIVGASVNMLL